MQDHDIIPNEPIEQLQDVVAQARDEVRLQVHLGNKELQDRYAALEARWSALQRRRAEVSETVDQTARDVRAGLRLALEELQSGYADLQRALGRTAES